MIDWEDFSLSGIVFKWENFLEERKAIPSGTKKLGANHLTVLERESLVDNLILRLENARECIEN